MLPIVQTTPVVQKNSIFGPGSTFQRKCRSKQTKPYDLPAPYTLNLVRILSGTLYGGGTWASTSLKAETEKNPVWGPSPNLTWDTFYIYRQWAYNASYAELKEALGSDSMMFVNLMERKQAMSALQGRAIQLLRFTALLRARRYKEAAQILAVPVPKGIARDARGRARSFADQFLEFHFGWEPLVKDIGNCVELLQNPLKSVTINAKGRKVRFDETFWGQYQHARYRGFARTGTGCLATVTNPNLYLANKLGFVNPAAVAWELIPFSFVVDWFVNVGDFLNQCTDLWGITLSNVFTTQLLKIDTCEVYYDYKYGAYRYGSASIHSGVWLDRQLALPGVTLGKRRPWRISPTRAATAISLLIQKGFRGTKTTTH